MEDKFAGFGVDKAEISSICWGGSETAGAGVGAKSHRIRDWLEGTGRAKAGQGKCSSDVGGDCRWRDRIG